MLTFPTIGIYGCSSGSSNDSSHNNDTIDPSPDQPGPDGGGDANLDRKVNIGINITAWGGAGADYNADKVWADAFRSHRRWVDAANNPIAIDENGWSISDGDVVLWHGLGRNTQDNHGTYRLSFECDTPDDVKVENVWSAASTFENKAVDGNTVHYDVIVDSPSDHMKLRFTNTGGGVRNAKLMRPVSPGSTESHPPDETFYRPFLAAIEPFGTLRYMHWMNIDNPLYDTNWSDRTRWTYATQQGAGGDDWGKSGPSWESVIKLANQTMTDTWICIPIRATDEYVRQLAILFRDGNEYTAPLHPDLKLYVEWANEHWNSGYYKQWAYAGEQAANSAACKFDGETDVNLLRRRYPGQRTVEISLIFRQVFGDNQMMTRIRPYLGHQLGWDDVINKTLSFVDRYYCGKSALSDYAAPHPMNYFLYGFGCTTYYFPDLAYPELTLENIWEDGTFNMDAHFDRVKSSAAWAKIFGLKYLAYEGGPHPNYNKEQDIIMREAVIDPRIYDKQIEHHKVFNAVGGDLVVYFELISGYTDENSQDSAGCFGAIRGSLLNLDSPRYKALADLAEMDPEPITFGTLAPFTLDGRQYDIINNYGSPPSTGAQTLSTDGIYFTGYAFQVPGDGEYGVTVEYSTSAAAAFDIEYDGNVITGFDVPDTDGNVQSTALMNFNSTADTLHAIRLVATSGEISIHTLTVEHYF